MTTKIINPGRLANVEQAAQYLLGCTIVRTLPGGKILSGKIIETEAYHQTDPGSHTFHGKTPRNAAMFGPPAHAYIYFTYGMHWCFNVTGGQDEEGAGVLIRAIEPLQGINIMQQNRHLQGPSLQNLTNGPAKLSQALAIDKNLYGHDLSQPPLQVFEGQPIPKKQIIKTNRIRVKKAPATLWRFYIKDNPFVSRW